MTKTGLRTVVCAALVFVQVPAAGAGQFYNEVISFGTADGATPPDRFELNAGVLPPRAS